MTSTVAPPTAVPSVDSRHRARVRARVKSWVTRPLMVALVVAQGWASFGTHGLGVWSGLAWWEAWIPVLLIDVVVVVTAHAATAGMLPAVVDDRERLRRLAWTIALVGFAFGLVANVLHRHVTAVAGTSLGATIVADILAGAPVLLVLICLVFRGRMEDYVERLTVADDTETVTAEQAAAQRAEQERAREARRRERLQEREVVAPPAPPVVPAAAAEPPAEQEAPVELHPVTGDRVAPTDPKIALYDRRIASDWAAGRNPDGGALDADPAQGGLGGTYGRKALRSFRAGVEILAAAPDTAVPDLDVQLRDRFKWANGTAGRVAAYVRHQQAAGAPLFPVGLSVVPEADSGEIPASPDAGPAAGTAA